MFRLRNRPNKCARSWQELLRKIEDLVPFLFLAMGNLRFSGLRGCCVSRCIPRFFVLPDVSGGSSELKRPIN